MIKIKVIEIRKYYKWISILLTCMMCILSFDILILDTKDIIVKANGLGKDSKFVQAEREQNISNHLMKLFINKALPLMEVHYWENEGYGGYSEIIRFAIGKIIRFDYNDPKTFFKAQISVLNEIDEDLAEENEWAGIEKENKNNNSEIHFVEEPTKGDKNDVPALSREKEENPSNTEDLPQRIEIVSSPIKMPNKVKLNMKKPAIFIYHTHGTESYLPEDVGNFHSLERKYTVRAVGDCLTENLEKKGYKIIHNDTLHDYPSYQQSYVRALETLKGNLEENSSLKIVFDIHRDAASNSEEARKNSYITINNEKVAKFSIVVGTKNENAEELKTFAEYIKAKSDELYPGLAKKTIPKEYKFNQYNSDYYALIEIGNTANDISEAVRTAKYLSEILDEVIKDIKE